MATAADRLSPEAHGQHHERQVPGLTCLPKITTAANSVAMAALRDGSEQLSSRIRRPPRGRPVAHASMPSEERLHPRDQHGIDAISSSSPDIIDQLGVRHELGQDASELGGMDRIALPADDHRRGRHPAEHARDPPRRRHAPPRGSRGPRLAGSCPAREACRTPATTARARRAPSRSGDDRIASTACSFDERFQPLGRAVEVAMIRERYVQGGGQQEDDPIEPVRARRDQMCDGAGAEDVRPPASLRMRKPPCPDPGEVGEPIAGLGNTRQARARGSRTAPWFRRGMG